MYKVVVVDDEPLILRSIKKSIEDTHTGFTVVGEAMNGEDSVAVIEKAAPDVIFTDIRMPVVDGLALIEELRKRKIQTKIVILSGYQEFGYAKRALKLGVEEYLLKPISRKDLKELLCRIYEDLEKAKSENQYSLLESFIHNDVNSSPLPSETNKYFSGYNCFGTALICSGSYCTFNCNWITPAKDFWFKTNLNSILDKVLQGLYKYWILELGHGNDKLVIFASDHETQYPFAEKCKQIYDGLKKTHFPITIVTGKPVTSIYDISHLLQYYKIILNKSIIFGSSSLIFADSPMDTEESLERLVSVNSEKLFSMFIEKKQSEQFKLEFKKILDSYNQKRLPQLRLVSMIKYVMNFFQVPDSSISQNRLLEIEMEIDELISNSFTYQSLFEGMSIIFDDLFYLLRNKCIEKNDQKIIADKVEHYIQQNYSQQISLLSISENFNVVLPYLSRVFKKYKGITPMDYIIHLRVEKAKELLKTNPSLSLKDIAQSVGYDDPYYLSRIFKSVTGKSPSEYRNCS